MFFTNKTISKFWDWYERHYAVNVGAVAILFLWQLTHLYWLTTAVVLKRLLGISYFHSSIFWQNLIIFVDYIEIPTHLAAMIIYLNSLRKKFNWKSVWLLVFLNLHWLHIFWITDEFVVNQFSGYEQIILPAWLAWIAIAIDYLEVPVILDTSREFYKSLRKKFANS